MGDERGGYVPEVGDRITYSTHNASDVNARVSQTERHGGYTNIWLEERNHNHAALFNINHSTLLPNTVHRLGATWELVSRKDSNMSARPQVGQRVRVTVSHSHMNGTDVPKGSEGVLRVDDRELTPFKVEFHTPATQGSFWFREGEIEVVESTTAGGIDVGTQVRSLFDMRWDSVSKGDVGVVTEIDSSDNDLPYYVRFGVDNHVWVRTEQVERVAAVWKQEIPSPPPAGVTRVAAVDQPTRVYVRAVGGDLWKEETDLPWGSLTSTWDELMGTWVNGVTEVIESDYDAAVRYFKSNPGIVSAMSVDDPLPTGATKHAAAIVAEVTR